MNDDDVLKQIAFRAGSWLPYHGAHAAAKRLEKRGLVKQSGFSIMPPHVLYTVTDAGAAAVKSMMAAHQRLRESDNEGGNL